MKILFAGPTLHGEIADGRWLGEPTIECRGPASQGDIAKAVLEGVRAIGLVDGRYEDVAAPWHKEILFALERGVAVFGAGSLGALRAAECAAFGMIGVGAIFERYVSGAMIDDSDVAQIHAPAELDYLPLTEALVNVEETLRSLAAAGRLEASVANDLCGLARTIFFKSLTYRTLFDRSSLPQTEVERLLNLLPSHRVDLKRQDARLLIARMLAGPTSVARTAWTMSRPPIWRRYIERLSGGN